MYPENTCKLLDWDTAFFGLKVARLLPSHLTDVILQQALTWCQIQAIECLYFLADCDRSETIQLAEQNGFSFVDIRMTFERDLNDMNVPSTATLPGVSIRVSQQRDLPYLRAIARNIYSDSRFHYDPHFPRTKAENLYVTWIDKSCNGSADAVLVVEKNEEPMGYITCHIVQPQVGQLGLVGLHPALQGIGAGQRLVYSALQQFNDWGIKRVEVVTQGRNCKAQRLYQRCGFLTQNLQLWYHKWFSK